MSSFTTKLVVEYLPKINKWKTKRELVYFVGEEYSEERIVVPRGFITDFASIPWPASMLIPKSGRYNQAAVLHDWLYDRAGVLDNKTYTRAEADKIFLEAMTVLKVNKFKRWVMYRHVRVWSWIFWNNHSYKNEKRRKK